MNSTVSHAAPSNGLIPRISICIPVYNGARHIAETLESVLSQEYEDMEILVQDNNSSDQTWEIIKVYSDKDRRISIQRNLATVDMASNWNLVLQRARAEFLMLLSADDLLRPTFVSRCLDQLRDDTVEIVTTNHMLLESGTERRRFMPIREGIRRLSPAIVLMMNPFSINFTVFQRGVLERVRHSNNAVFTPGLWTCDYDLWLKLSRSRTRIKYLIEPLGTYRVHANSLSTQRLKMLEQTKTVLDFHRSWLLKEAPISSLITQLRLLYRRAKIQHISSGPDSSHE